MTVFPFFFSTWCSIIFTFLSQIVCYFIILVFACSILFAFPLYFPSFWCCCSYLFFFSFSFPVVCSQSLYCLYLCFGHSSGMSSFPLFVQKNKKMRTLHFLSQSFLRMYLSATSLDKKFSCFEGKPTSFPTHD